MGLLGHRRAPQVLSLALLFTAFGLIGTSHECRTYYARLQALELQRWAAEEDYSRLLLEESTLASPHRVISVAQDVLTMQPPMPERIVVVSP